MQYDKNVPQHDIKKGAKHKRGTLYRRMQKGWHPIVYIDMSDVMLAAVYNLLLTVWRSSNECLQHQFLHFQAAS